jgi:predicted NBD/HSP70 family sugar kinase
MRNVTLPLATVRLMRELTRKRKTTQPELQSALRLSAPTVFRAVSQLRDLGILLEGDQVASEARGRPAVELRLRPKGYCVFSLVIRSDESWLYLVDAHGNTKQPTSIPISGSDSYEQALTLYAREISAMTEEARREYDLNAGVGVSFAGSVDPETGFLTTPSRFPDWRGRPFAADLTQRTGLHCSVDNDTTALGRAILWFSSSEDAHSFALVNIDIGLGAGFCFEGHIHTGQKRVPSGLAHTTAFGWSQDPCRCGRQGCLETVLSVGGVLKQAEAGGIKLDQSEPSMSIAALQNLERVAQTENGLAARLLQQTGERAAIVGASIARVLNLPMIVFAGGFIRTSQVAWSALDQEMTRQTLSGDLQLSWRRYDNLVTNEHPEALGATAVALDELRRSRVVTILNPSFARPQASFTISKAEEEATPF